MALDSRWVLWKYCEISKPKKNTVTNPKLNRHRFRLRSRRDDWLRRLAFGSIRSQIERSIACVTSAAASWIDSNAQPFISTNKARLLNYATEKTVITAWEFLGFA